MGAVALVVGDLAGNALVFLDLILGFLLLLAFFLRINGGLDGSFTVGDFLLGLVLFDLLLAGFLVVGSWKSCRAHAA